MDFDRKSVDYDDDDDETTTKITPDGGKMRPEHVSVLVRWPRSSFHLHSAYLYCYTYVERTSACWCLCGRHIVFHGDIAVMIQLNVGETIISN